MVSLDLPDAIVCLDGDFLDLYCERLRLLLEFHRREVLPGIMNDLVGRSEIHINPAET